MLSQKKGKSLRLLFVFLQTIKIIRENRKKVQRKCIKIRKFSNLPKKEVSTFNNMERKFYLTKEGLEKIEKEYYALKKMKQAKVSDQDSIPEPMHSEELNLDYVHFQEDLAFLEVRIMELDQIIKNVNLIKPSLLKKKKTVDVGATVFVENKGKEDQFVIVDTIEADPFLGKISKESPIGKALIGKKEGDEVVIATDVDTVYKVKKVNYLCS